MSDDADEKPTKKKPRTIELLVPPLPGQNDDDDDEQEERARPRGPRVGLLPQWGSKNATPDHLAVFRIDPPHGYLGNVGLDADEALLASRFGGKVLRLELRAADGAKITGANNQRTLAIASDPIIPQTAAARATLGTPTTEAAQWDRAEVIRQSAEERVQLLKAEIDSRAEREAARIRADMERMKLEHQQGLERERERARQETERARQEIERERERAKLEREREREQAQAMLALVTNSNAANLQMMNAQHAQSMEMMTRLYSSREQQDPLAALKVGVELATSIGAGAQGDEATKSFDKLLDVAKEGIRAVGRAPRLPAPRAAAQMGAGDASGPEDKKARVKAKLAAALKGLEANGQDLESVLDALNSQLGSAPPAATPAEPQKAPAKTPSLGDFTGDD
jgi:hypothetical protein